MSLSGVEGTVGTVGEDVTRGGKGKRNVLLHVSTSGFTVWRPDKNIQSKVSDEPYRGFGSTPLNTHMAKIAGTFPSTGLNTSV